MSILQSINEIIDLQRQMDKISSNYRLEIWPPRKSFEEMHRINNICEVTGVGNV